VALGVTVEDMEVNRLSALDGSGESVADAVVDFVADGLLLGVLEEEGDAPSDLVAVEVLVMVRVGVKVMLAVLLPLTPVVCDAVGSEVLSGVSLAVLLTDELNEGVTEMDGVALNDLLIVLVRVGVSEAETGLPDDVADGVCEEEVEAEALRDAVTLSEASDEDETLGDTLAATEALAEELGAAEGDAEEEGDG
jgi:hypothetical protein